MIHVGRYLGIVMEDADYFQESMPSRTLGRTVNVQHDMLLTSVPHLKSFHSMLHDQFRYVCHDIKELPYNRIARQTRVLVDSITAINPQIQILVFQYAIVAVISLAALIDARKPLKYQLSMITAESDIRNGYAHTHQELLWVYKNLRQGRLCFPHTSLTLRLEALLGSLKT